MSRLRWLPNATRLLTITTAALMAGCSAGGPATPPAQAPAAAGGEFNPRPIITAVSGDTVLANSPFMAIDVVVDPLTLEAELLPVRTAQAPPTGQKYTVNLMELLQTDPCSDCIGVLGVSKLPNGNIQLDLGITHPIAAFNAPVGTAALHVNNVRGFVVSDINGPDGVPFTLDEPQTYDLTGFNAPEPLGYGDTLQSVIAGFVANADGYSGDITPIIAPGFDTIYPYVVFGADDGTVGVGNFGTDGWRGNELESPTGYNVWAQGSTITGRYELALANGAVGTNEISFRLVLTASYIFARKHVLGQLASPQDPLYFMPEGALLSPWRVTVENDGIDGLGTPPGEGTNAVVNLDIKIRDWQKPIDNTGIVPGLTPTTAPTGVLGRSWPGAVGVDIPGVTSGIQRYDVIGSTAAGTEADPITLSAPVVNSASAPSGTYVGFVRVEDERSNGPTLGVSGSHELYEVGGVDASLTPYNLGADLYRYTTYQAFVYEIADRPLRAAIDYAASSVGGRVVLDARSSGVDAPEAITSYDWVFNYTGVPSQFNTPDVSSVSPLYTGLPTYASAGAHVLGLRVTDTLARTDIVTTTILVDGNRDPFVAPDPIVNIVNGVTLMRYGVSSQDFADSTVANPVGGNNAILLGQNIYTIFYGKPGTNPEGLWITGSANAGTSWAAPTMLKNKASFTQYGGAAITGSKDGSGNDRLYVALGNTSYSNSGTGTIYVFSHPQNGNTGVAPWTESLAANYALSATKSAAVSPAIVANPNNANEVHLVYGTDTGGLSVGINRRLEIKASTNGAAGLAADPAEIIDGALGADVGWYSSGTTYALEIAQHPQTEDLFILLGGNQHSYILRSTNHGASYPRPAYAVFNHGVPFQRDGDLVLDPWDANIYYVGRVRRGNSFATSGQVSVLQGTGNTLALLGQARSAAELPGAHNPLAAHVALAFHESGELEAYWTEALGPAGAGTYMNTPHIQHDLVPYGTNFGFDPDRTGPNGTTVGLNPTVIPSVDGMVHIIWADPTLGTIFYRKG